MDCDIGFFSFFMVFPRMGRAETPTETPASG